MSTTVSRLRIGVAAFALIAAATVGAAGSASADTLSDPTATPTPTASAPATAPLGSDPSTATPTPTPTQTAAPTPTPSAEPLADAATPVLTSSTTTFALGGWEAGITAEGTGFPADTTVTVSVVVHWAEGFAGGGTTTLGSTDVTSSANGDISVVNWVPDGAPVVLDYKGLSHAFLVASYTPAGGDPVSLDGPEITFTHFASLDTGITLSQSCVSSEDLETTGIAVSAKAFFPGEHVMTYLALSDRMPIVLPGGTPGGDSRNPLAVGADGTIALTYTAAGVADGDYSFNLYGIDGDVNAGYTVPFTVSAACGTPVLANTGSGDAGLLVGGSALLLLAGAALVFARRRVAAAK